MKISFDSLEEQNIQNFKGGEGVFKPRMHVGNYNKIMRATLPAGSSIDFTHMTPTARSYLSSQELGPWSMTIPWRYSIRATAIIAHRDTAIV